MELYCIGDSLTFGFGVRPAQRWTTLTAGQSGWTVKAFGVCGDTAPGMLVRLRELLPTLPMRGMGKCFLLMGGSNDIFYAGSDATARASMGAMIHQLLSLGAEPIVGIPLPIAGDWYPQAWGQAVDFSEAARMLADYEDWLEKYSRAFSLRCVDFRPDFLDGAGQLRRELYLDGLHPNEEGHRLMAARLAAFLQSLPRDEL